VIETKKSFNCNNAGTAQSSCSSFDVNTTKTVCGSGSQCVNGSCVTSCVPNWICNEYSECINGTQLRSCADGCGSSKTETIQCNVQKIVSFRTTSLKYESTSAVALALTCGQKLTAYGGTSSTCKELNCLTQKQQFNVPGPNNILLKAWIRSSGRDVCICVNKIGEPRRFNINDSDKKKVNLSTTSIDSKKETLCTIAQPKCTSGECCSAQGIVLPIGTQCGEPKYEKYCANDLNVMLRTTQKTCDGFNPVCGTNYLTTFSQYYTTCTGETNCLNGACVSKCTPNWVCEGWSECIPGITTEQTRICADLNSCGVQIGIPETSKECTTQCNPSEPCCDSLGNYKENGTICQENVSTEKRCNNNAVESRNLSYACTGTSQICSPINSVPGEWTITQQCAQDQVCSNNSCVSACTPSWVCSDWQGCTNGKTNRTCYDSKNCGTEANKPSTQMNCVPCIDTDGGKNTKTLGYTLGLFSSINPTAAIKQKDYCVNSNILREYYCADVLRGANYDTICTKGCSNGICK